MLVSFEGLEIDQTKELIARLVQLNDSQVDEALIEASRQVEAVKGHEMDRAYVAQGLSLHGFERLTDLLEGADLIDDFKRSLLCDAIGLTKNPDGINLLSNEYINGAEKTRLWAALALSKMGEIAVISIKELLLQFGDNSNRLLLLDALFRIGTARAIHSAEDFLNGIDPADAQMIRSFL